ncbi:transcriptional regulator NrdR [Exiguobacterium sp. Leaf187]|uniref:Transcriptional repressor NrdR n=2 Tax=Exiguobacterium TaxID=33986 RepID=A0A0V8GJB8_9BACL|nr:MULTISPECIES: transcriptional regulator NrdR [Exiguobacterium]AHA30409.1 NrdR family transcriptional regulator [Exiguobacterium sp. MH3]AOT01373.1 transcriptional regulator NrdR [Exiguobacterium sp. U13-1]KNH36648.1 transcriptional regulator NrdR [Exiguobacterium acetylicum]KQS19641.1 transcriptional regulator NrdR [Exiguobacterium sp. Leaf187]KSU50348.1 transcriptional regulator NrdR [Exiguobacterium enclense]
MRCPACNFNGTKVLDSRPVQDFGSIRRRRECESCGYRFTTFEMVEQTPLIIVKKDGTRDEFNRDKILRGLVRACEKRPISIEQLETVVSRVEKALRATAQHEIPSEQVGRLVLNELASVDEVAYVRFASVYKQFKDINVFFQELSELMERHQENDREN